jgi:sterol desaturase/sphingolipid hydroxylase (fatty acid hydroxylase superfamily)
MLFDSAVVSLTVLSIAVLMIACELVKPGREWPIVRYWWLRALVLDGCQAGVVWIAGSSWEPWLRDHRPWSADALGHVVGAVVGYFLITFVYYFWHRARHEIPLLWRWLHQVHHSPQRIEIITSFYKHPLEVIANSLLSATILYAVVGVGAVAATEAILLTGIAELFYHWNVSTPYWLGFLVQRPESHCVHHESGAHSYNYSDLPLWDVLFGTFRNPLRSPLRCGFGDDEERLVDMLRGVDVTASS